jgi:hypothetical protein
MKLPHEASPRFTVRKPHYLLCKRQKQSLQASLNLTTKTQHTSIVKPAKRQFQQELLCAFKTRPSLECWQMSLTYHPRQCSLAPCTATLGM